MIELPKILNDYLNNGKEERYLEYKADIPWTDKPKKLEIIKTILAMSNFRDGGVIIIGVNDKGVKIGLSEQNFETFSHDKLNQFLNGKTNQPVVCKVHKHVFNDESGEKRFVFIQVAESKEYPLIYTGSLILKNDSVAALPTNIALRPFAMYIRNKAEVGNKEIDNVDEFQELIERTHKKYEKETIRRNELLQTNETNPFDEELL